MKYQFSALAIACAPFSASAFVSSGVSNAFGIKSSSSTLSMVLEKPRTAKKLAKIEVLKINSDHLTVPLKDVSITLYCYNVMWLMLWFRLYYQFVN
jgi:hypothetical protein